MKQTKANFIFPLRDKIYTENTNKLLTDLAETIMLADYLSSTMQTQDFELYEKTSNYCVKRSQDILSQLGIGAKG